MLLAIREIGMNGLEVLTYIIVASMLLCAAWVLVSHYWVFRRGGISGVLKWHRNTKIQYQFNDVRISLSILALTVVGVLVSIQDVRAGLLPGVNTILGAMIFLIIGCLVGERRKHWGRLKSSAREVVMRDDLV